MQYRKKQKGLTLLGGIFALALLSLLSLAIIRLFPIYLEYFSVKSSLAALASQPRLHQMNNIEIRDILLRQLDINEVEHIFKEDIEIARTRQTSIVAIDYEVRTPFLGNIDLIAHFNRTIEVPLN